MLNREPLLLANRILGCSDGGGLTSSIQSVAKGRTLIRRLIDPNTPSGSDGKEELEMPVAVLAFYPAVSQQ